MLMNDLLEERFFNLLSEKSQVTTYEMQQAYENFVKQVETLNQSDGGYITIYRLLNLTRIELISLSRQFRYEQEKKCLKQYLFAESCFCY